jgi:hypothetical protein
VKKAPNEEIKAIGGNELFFKCDSYEEVFSSFQAYCEPEQVAFASDERFDVPPTIDVYE